jgi:hypothetical protein
MGKGGPLFDMARPAAPLVAGDRRRPHDELGHHGRQQPGHHESRAAGRLGHEHHTGQRDPVAGPQKGGDAQHHEQRLVAAPHRKADQPPGQRALHGQGDEQAPGSAAGHAGRSGHRPDRRQAGHCRHRSTGIEPPFHGPVARPRLSDAGRRHGRRPRARPARGSKKNCMATITAPRILGRMREGGVGDDDRSTPISGARVFAPGAVRRDPGTGAASSATSGPSGEGTTVSGCAEGRVPGGSPAFSSATR